MIATTTKTTTNNTVLIFHIAAIRDCKNSSITLLQKTISLCYTHKWEEVEL